MLVWGHLGHCTPHTQSHGYILGLMKYSLVDEPLSYHVDEAGVYVSGMLVLYLVQQIRTDPPLESDASPLCAHTHHGPHHKGEIVRT